MSSQSRRCLENLDSPVLTLGFYLQDEIFMRMGWVQCYERYAVDDAGAFQMLQIREHDYVHYVLANNSRGSL
ncbi:hypothetical protein AB1N83_002518 [Pleurotus pulmonarius]